MRKMNCNDKETLFMSAEEIETHLGHRSNL